MNKPIGAGGAPGDVAAIQDKGDTVFRSHRKEQRAIRLVHPEQTPAADAKLEQLVSEDAAALAFVCDYGERLRYDHDRKAWFYWDDAIWRRDRTGLGFSWARDVARDLVRGRERKIKEKVGTAKFAAGVETFSKKDQAIAALPSDWDTNPHLIGTPGGTVDLRTGLLRDPDKDDMITMVTAVTPSGDESCPLFLRFLSEATGGDPDLQWFLKILFGYCLTGLTTEQTIAFLYGFGGNGKGVLLNTVSRIANDYARTAQMGTFTASKLDKGSEELAALMGARLVTAQETDEGRKWAEAKLKQLTGGDPIRARRLYENSIEFVPTFKLVFSGNYAPEIENLDDAMRRRFLILPFKHKPARPDPELPMKLQPEWPGILRWMINGAVEWYSTGLPRPEVVMAETREYFESQDLFGAWLQEQCRIEPGNDHLRSKSTELFEDWKRFAVREGNEPGNSRKFNRNMAKQRFKKKQIKEFGTKGYLGIVLLTPAYGDDR